MLDIGWLGNILGSKRNWSDAFARHYGNSNKKRLLGWIDEVREVRNAVAHPQAGDLAHDDAWRCLDTMERILGPATRDAAKELRSLKARLVEYDSGEGRQ